MKKSKIGLLISLSIVAVFALSACANASATEAAPLEYNTQVAEEQTAQNDVLTLLNDAEIAEEPIETDETTVDDTPQITYVIATTIEEIENILALQDGSIPLTNIEVTADSLGFSDGVIITVTEQDLQEALDVLNQTSINHNLVTPFIEFSPTIDEIDEGRLFALFRMFVNEVAHEHSDFDMFNDQFTDEERELVNAEGERLLAEYGRNAMFEEETLYNTARLVFGERFDFE